jgi:hypothetical protein
VTDYQGYKEQRQILELAPKAKQQPYLIGGFAGCSFVSEAITAAF